MAPCHLHPSAESRTYGKLRVRAARSNQRGQPSGPTTAGHSEPVDRDNLSAQIRSGLVQKGELGRVAKRLCGARRNEVLSHRASRKVWTPRASSPPEGLPMRSDGLWGPRSPGARNLSHLPAANIEKLPLSQGVDLVLWVRCPHYVPVGLAVGDRHEVVSTVEADVSLAHGHVSRRGVAVGYEPDLIGILYRLACLGHK